MSDLVVALGFLLVAGWPLARLVTGDRVLALVWAPLGAALISVAAVLGTLAVGIEVRVAMVVLWAASVAALGRRSSRLRLPPANRQGLVAVIVLTAFTLWTVRQGAVGWDARSQFWLKADAFWAGGHEARMAMGNPGLAFAHHDYPPLLPSAIAALWSFVGAGDERLAQSLSGLLSHSMLLAAAAALLMLPLRVSARVRVAVAVASVLASHGVTGTQTTNGYGDVLCAALVAAAAVLLLVHPPGRQATIMGVVCLAGAALSKNEGATVALVLGGLAAYRHRRRVAWALSAAAAAALGPAWWMVARALGAQGDLLVGDPWSRAFRPGFPTRLRLIVDAHWEQVMLTVVGTVLVAGFAAIGLRAVRQAAGLGSAAVLPAVALSALLASTAAYIVTPYPLESHIGASVSRVTFLPILLLLAEVGVCALVAAHAWRVPDAGDTRIR